MEDIFLRADSFKQEPWYNEFRIFTAIGVCMPPPEHLEAVKAALVQMGYSPTEKMNGGKIYVVG